MAAVATNAAVPRLFATPGCPHVFKCLAFLADAGLMDGRVEIVEDSPAQRAWVSDKAGGARAVFPALFTTDEKIIMFPDTDGIVDHLAAQFGVDTSKLYVYNHYVEGVFPRYGALLGNVIKTVGGWPPAFPSVGIQRLLLLGGTGMVGSRLAAEGRRRGHFVTIGSRSAPDLAMNAKVDASDPVALEAVLRAGIGYQAVVVALGPSRTNPDAPALIDVYKSIVAACRATGTRLFFVGGAGSLFTADGSEVLQMNAPEFPDFIKPEAQAHADALAWLRTVDDVNWTSLAPPPMIHPGERTGKYKLGGDAIVGFTISAEDYAVAAMDEIDTPKHEKARFAVAAAE
jgi:putative NADH-flavin reductase